MFGRRQTNKQKQSRSTATNEHTNKYRNWNVTGTATYWQNKYKETSVPVIRRQFGLIAVQPNDSFATLGMNNIPSRGWRRQIPPKAANIYQTTRIIHPAPRSKERQSSHCVSTDDFLYLVRFFYRCSEHFSCHGMSRPTQAQHAEKLPCSVRRLKEHTVYTHTHVHTHTQIATVHLPCSTSSEIPQDSQPNAVCSAGPAFVAAKHTFMYSVYDLPFTKRHLCQSILYNYLCEAETFFTS